MHRSFEKQGTGIFLLIIIVAVLQIALSRAYAPFPLPNLFVVCAALFIVIPMDNIYRGILLGMALIMTPFGMSVPWYAAALFVSFMAVFWLVRRYFEYGGAGSFIGALIMLHISVYALYFLFTSPRQFLGADLVMLRGISLELITNVAAAFFVLALARGFGIVAKK